MSKREVSAPHIARPDSDQHGPNLLLRIMTMVTQLEKSQTGREPTVNERVYFELKSMIAQRRLAPGTPLILRTLSQQLGVSNTPVIEAIRRGDSNEMA